MPERNPVDWLTKQRIELEDGTIWRQVALGGATFGGCQGIWLEEGGQLGDKQALPWGKRVKRLSSEVGVQPEEVRQLDCL